MKNWIVYKHENKINGKIYIGITSQNPIDRWKNGNGYSKHKKFYSAIKKYGWDNFLHIILYTGLTEKEAKEKEQELIKFYDSKNSGYNLTDGGDGIIGYHHSEETKRKISNSQKQNDHKEKTKQINEWNKKHSIEHSKIMKDKWKDKSFKKEMGDRHKKKVLCITTNKIFNSINEAADFANISPSGISKCLKDIQKTAGKHPITKEKLQWKYI